MMATVIEVRQALVARGFVPIPVIGKVPSFKSWQKVENVSREWKVGRLQLARTRESMPAAGERHPQAVAVKRAGRASARRTSAREEKQRDDKRRKTRDATHTQATAR